FSSILFSFLITCIIFLLFPLLTSLFFFFTDPAPTEIYTLSLHDALPIYVGVNEAVSGLAVLLLRRVGQSLLAQVLHRPLEAAKGDRKSTRLNSSHVAISYAVFCLKKKKKRINSYTL